MAKLDSDLISKLIFIIYKLTNPWGPIPVYFCKKVETTRNAKGLVTHWLAGFSTPIFQNISLCGAPKFPPV